MFDKFFDIQTIPFYLLGIVVFFITIIDDLLHSKRSFWLYLQDFLFALLAISIGISCCYVFELQKALCWIIVIGCGFVGATLMRRIDSRKEHITDKTIDKALDATLDKIEKKIKGSEYSNEEKDENC